MLDTSMWQVGPIRIDAVAERVWHGSDAVPLRPKTWAVLKYLLERPGQLVTKQELLGAVWEKTAVEEKALNASIGEIRRAFGDSARQPRYLETVHRRGFRFIAHVTGDEATDPGAQRPPPPALEESPFVGRDDELARLGAALAEAGRGRIVVISGPAGVGKSRLVRELLHVPGATGSLTGQCVEGGGVPYAPWIEMIRTCMRSASPGVVSEAWGAAGAELVRIVPALSAEGAGPIVPSDDADRELTRLRLFEAIGLFFEGVAAKHPLVIVIEDLHWADPASLRALQALAPRLLASSVRIVATVRDEEREPGSIVAHSLDQLASRGAIEEIQLAGLGEPAATALVRASGTRALPDPVLQQVVATSQGNPFFIQEMLRHLRELALLDDSGDWRSRLLGQSIDLPSGVALVFERRVRRLSLACRKLLDFAAVIGSEFDEWLLSDALAADQDEIVDGLVEAMAAGIVLELPDRAGCYRFGHDLMRATLYQRQLGPLRRRVHLRVAESIEALRGVDADTLPELALHLTAAVPTAEPERALEITLQAAEAARQRLAYESEADLFASALALADAAKTPALRSRGAELSVLHAEALQRAGQAHASTAAFRDATRRARENDEPEWLARGSLGLATLWEYDDPGVSTVIEDALERLRERDPILRTRLLARLAVVLYPQPGTRERCEALCNEALARARGSDDAQLLGHTVADCLAGQWYPDNLPTQQTLADELMRVAEQSGDRELRATAHGWRVVIGMGAGEIAKARREVETLVPLADELRQPIHQWYGRYLSATLAHVRGDLALAERLSHEAFAVGQRCSPNAARRVYSAQLFSLRREQGRMAELLPTLREPDYANAFMATWTLPVALLDADCIDEARDAFAAACNRGLDAMLPDNSRNRSLVALVGMAYVCTSLRETSIAAEIYERLAPYAERWIVSGWGNDCYGQVGFVLGPLAASQGRFATAERHFEAALAAHEREGAAAALAMTLHRYAEMLLERGRSGDSGWARELVERGSELARDLGLARTQILFDRLQARLDA